ncbi:MAG: PilZ domain-containing protein [Aestuariivirga sp.]
MEEDPNQRSVMRRRVLKDGKIIISPPSGTLNVKIRDLSENGAKLEILATTPLPEKFDLIIVADATVTLAEVMWRKGNFVGVHFCGETRKVALRKT